MGPLPPLTGRDVGDEQPEDPMPVLLNDIEKYLEVVEEIRDETGHDPEWKS